jgi:hypothetical protein
MSCDNEATRGFGPLVPGHLKVDFGDAVGLEKIFKGLNTMISNHRVVLEFFLIYCVALTLSDLCI